MDNKRLTNVQKPTERNDAVNNEYLRSFHRKNEDIHMNNKAIKNFMKPIETTTSLLKNI
jgi:hypothetical protein